MSGGTFSVLGADVVIKGDISATADLHIDGRVEGDIVCAALVQGQSSEVVGAIRAETARLSGSVRGSITASELVILKTAHIEGDVFYDALTIEQGAEVDGRFAHRVHAAPAAGEPALPLPGDDGEPRLTLAS
ncbi:MAG: polymer-forming cytoskeletal protein [Novosphingobium sp.]